VPPGQPDYHPYTNDHASDSRIDVLLRLGADPNRRLTKQADWTPLAIALASDRDPALLAATLLKFGADPNARWRNAMHWFGYGRLSPVTERPAGCSASTGTTPLILAASRCDAQEVTTLLEHGADATLRDWTGRTARDYAKSCNGNVLAAFRHGR
jgi:ankyrin repeat protein